MVGNDEFDFEINYINVYSTSASTTNSTSSTSATTTISAGASGTTSSKSAARGKMELLGRGSLSLLVGISAGLALAGGTIVGLVI